VAMDQGRTGGFARWEIHLRSSTDQLRHLRARLRRLLRPLHLTSSTLHDIVLSAHEAAVNGMVHGNRLDLGKQVTVTVELHGDSVAIEVADEGPGFDWQPWLRCLQQARLAPEAVQGRGLLLISELVDRVSFNEAGNIVRLVKRVDRAP
jgi:serine/threonine-protein kinase RsbW